MKHVNREQNQQGFTLIELVVVIAILAILAAFALPRFAQLSEQAHNSSVKGTAGALSASVALVKAQWVTNGFSGEQDDIEGFGNDNIDVSDEGWPVSTNGANNPANMDADICVDLWEQLMQSNAPTVASSGTTTDYVASTATNGCTFTYLLDGETDASAKAIGYNAETGEITTVNVN